MSDSVVRYELIFDGGSRGNPGDGYGSYSIKRGSGRFRKPVRCTFGRTTNNEAEYMALIEGLHGLLDEVRKGDVPLKDVEVIIRGDSQLVLNQVGGGWKAKNPRMRTYRDQAKRLAGLFGRVAYKHHDRSKSVEVLGH